MSNNRSTLGQYETYEPKVKEGDLIIFPSTIQHEASTNMSNKRRTIISFNLK
jgi:ectoine hydroxylase-related dioxygenase (phytanoyl-CoA dioxygenase family)